MGKRWQRLSKKALRLDRPRPVQPVRVAAPFYIVCEGAGDAAFLQALLTSRGVPSGAFQIAEAEGYTQFQRHFDAVMTSPDRSLVTRFAVVADNDDVPATRFANVQMALQNAGLPVPPAPETIVPGPPVVGVFMLPTMGVPGALETLLMDAVVGTTEEIGQCVDAFRTCVAAPGAWGPSKIGKMRINSAIAACCIEDPSASLAYVWGKVGNPIPIESVAFEPLAAFLQAVSVT